MVEIKVDLEKCNGCGTCVDVCPVSVFELQDVEGYDTKKASPVNQDACIVCRSCEVQCPQQAITVVE